MGPPITRHFSRCISMETQLSPIVWVSTRPTLIKSGVSARPSHEIKKVHISIFNSGYGEKHTQQIVKDGIPIQWLQWINAFEWCQDRISYPIAPHPKSTREHIYLSARGKMHNALARHVLDENMLHLCKHNENLSGGHAASFSAYIELLSQTAVLIKFFNDKQPVNSTDDHRISDLKRVVDWLKSWETSAASAKKLMTSECKQDLTWMTIGMERLVKMAVEEYKTAIYPTDINSDVIKNFFCSEGGVWGDNRTNPFMHNSLYISNSIFLGQFTILKFIRSTTSPKIEIVGSWFKRWSATLCASLYLSFIGLSVLFSTLRRPGSQLLHHSYQLSADKHDTVLLLGDINVQNHHA